MTHKKKIELTAALMPLMAALLSCEPAELAITDRSFLFSATVAAGTESSCPTVTLTLEKGDRGTSYDMTYVVDSDPTLRLASLSDVADAGRISLSFDGCDSFSWLLPALGEGEHAIVFSIRGDGYSQELEVPFTVSHSPFAIHAEVFAPQFSVVTTLIVSLVSGTSDRDYTGMVYVDGRPVDPEGFTVNFSRTPVFSCELPALRPGGHALSVEISDGRLTRTFPLDFEEPLRHPDLDVVISHDSESGHSLLTVSGNPYGLSLAVTDSLVVTGRCEYGVPSPPEGYEMRTDGKVVKEFSSLDRFIPRDGVRYDLLDRELTERKVTDAGVQTYVWEREWRTDGDGYWHYYEVPGPFVRYTMTSSLLYVTAEFEHLEGVTVHVRSSEPGCSFNGHTIGPEEEYSYQL